MNPNSYDLRLAPKLLVYDRQPMLNDRTIRERRGNCRNKHCKVHGPKKQVIHTYATDYAKAMRKWVKDRERGKPREDGFKRQPLDGVELYHQKPIELAQWDNVIDMGKENPTYEFEIPETGAVLLPGRLYIGSTIEYTETHDLVPCIDGRSSIGRLGIDIHSTAGFGDVGFCGTWTLEISVVEPVRIYAGVRFCQIHYEEIKGGFIPYESSKYQGQRDPRPSKIWKELQGDEAARNATSPEQPGDGPAVE